MMHGGPACAVNANRLTLDLLEHPDLGRRHAREFQITPDLIDPFKEIRLPGELEWRRQQEKETQGVPLDPEVYTDLRLLATELQVPWPF